MDLKNVMTVTTLMQATVELTRVSLKPTGNVQKTCYWRVFVIVYAAMGSEQNRLKRETMKTLQMEMGAVLSVSYNKVTIV